MSIWIFAFLFQLEVSPPFLARQTCALGAIRGSTSVGLLNLMLVGNLTLSSRNLNNTLLRGRSREGDVSWEGLASAMPAL